MSHNTLPDDLNPALIEVCARFIGKLTGLVPPPVADFPPEMHAVFRQFAAEAYTIVRENVTKPAPAAEPRHWNPVYNTDPIQRACAELPEGWEMQVCMENGAGWIDLYDPAGEKFEPDIDADKFDWKIHEAIDIAIEADRAGGKPC
ncbi:hypothetical protein [Burkholderia ubonensis]|uniref:hypothetical protein n=1 Tax=Burkholderia ubonensis TaxID=101571 RepID=UPI00075B9616|nr:hypothetical protein [Burkholderia ubonensis]KUZ78260.1 hypothetical protein WI37_10970 [Burkholderia ubonensis]